MNNLAPISNPSAMSTSEVVEYFLSRESAGTSRTYSAALKSFFIWAGTGTRLTDISPFIAMNYNTYLKTVDSEATVQRKISTLKSFFGFAKECGVIQGNPFAIVKQHKTPNKMQDKFLTEKELDRLLTALSKAGKREYTLGLLLASLGLRISEAQNLSHNDFIESPSGDIEVRLLRKGNKVQLVPIRQDVWNVVQDLMGHGLNAYDTRPLFQNYKGDRISDVSLRNWIKDAAKKAGIAKQISPHTLRHTTASLLLDRGESLENVRWLMNHSSVSVTSIYLHPTDKKISEKMPIKVLKEDR